MDDDMFREDCVPIGVDKEGLRELLAGHTNAMVRWNSRNERVVIYLSENSERY